MDNNELYFEEQRQQLIDLNKQVKSLYDISKKQLEIYKAPVDKVIVSGSVKVNTEKEVEITNLEAVEDYLKELSKDITSAIEKSVREPLNELTIKNIADAKAENIKVTNLNELSKSFEAIKNAILNNQPIINVEKENIDLPYSATKPLAVRLSDGKSFYNAIANAVSGGMANFVNTENRGVPVKLTADNKVPVDTNLDEKLTSKISTLNSTDVQLGINQTFTGTWEDVTNYAEVIVTVYTTHTSVTDGLKVEWSMNGTDIQGSDVFTITASSSRTFSFPAQTKYFRVRYTNDGVATTTFQLQSVLKIRASKGSSHRLKDNLNQEDDAIVTKSQIVGFTTGGGGGTDLINVKVTPSGALTTDTTISGNVSVQSSNEALKLTESGNYTYVAKAPVGTLESAAAWKVFRIDETNGLKITWADGNANYDNVATNLTTLTYS